MLIKVNNMVLMITQKTVMEIKTKDRMQSDIEIFN